MNRTQHGRAKGNAKRVNQITHYGIMGGLAPQRNASVSTLRGYRGGHAKLKQPIPPGPVQGLAYMMGQNPMGRYMLSRNPQCSGGVGRMFTTARGTGAYPTPPVTLAQDPEELPLFGVSAVHILVTNLPDECFPTNKNPSQTPTDYPEGTVRFFLEMGFNLALDITTADKDIWGPCGDAFNSLKNRIVYLTANADNASITSSDEANNLTTTRICLIEQKNVPLPPSTPLSTTNPMNGCVNGNAFRAGAHIAISLVCGGPKSTTSMYPSQSATGGAFWTPAPKTTNIENNASCTLNCSFSTELSGCIMTNNDVLLCCASRYTHNDNGTIGCTNASFVCGIGTDVSLCGRSISGCTDNRAAEIDPANIARSAMKNGMFLPISKPKVGADERSIFYYSARSDNVFQLYIGIKDAVIETVVEFNWLVDKAIHNGIKAETPQELGMRISKIDTSGNPSNSYQFAVLSDSETFNPNGLNFVQHIGIAASQNENPLPADVMGEPGTLVTITEQVWNMTTIIPSTPATLPNDLLSNPKYTGGFVCEKNLCFSFEPDTALDKRAEELPGYCCADTSCLKQGCKKSGACKGDYIDMEDNPCWYLSGPASTKNLILKNNNKKLDITKLGTDYLTSGIHSLITGRSAQYSTVSANGKCNYGSDPSSLCPHEWADNNTKCYSTSNAPFPALPPTKENLKNFTPQKSGLCSIAKNHYWLCCPNTIAGQLQQWQFFCNNSRLDPTKTLGDALNVIAEITIMGVNPAVEEDEYDQNKFSQRRLNTPIIIYQKDGFNGNNWPATSIYPTQKGLLVNGFIYVDNLTHQNNKYSVGLWPLGVALSRGDISTCGASDTETPLCDTVGAGNGVLLFFIGPTKYS